MPPNQNTKQISKKKYDQIKMGTKAEKTIFHNFSIMSIFQRRSLNFRNKKQKWLSNTFISTTNEIQKQETKNRNVILIETIDMRSGNQMIIFNLLALK